MLAVRLMQGGPFMTRYGVFKRELTNFGETNGNTGNGHAPGSLVRERMLDDFNDLRVFSGVNGCETRPAQIPVNGHSAWPVIDDRYVPRNVLASDDTCTPSAAIR
jgi:hypothetical protein